MTFGLPTGCWGWLAAGLFVRAIQAAEAAPVVVSDSPTIRTFGIDSKDYDVMAAKLASSLLNSAQLELHGKKVLSLGPVTDDDCLYRLDAQTLQEALQAILVESGKIKVNFVTEAVKGNSAAQERVKVMLLQYEKETAVDPEDLRVFGKLANVDYLLFGRVSAQTTTAGKVTEVTYRFNWKLGDCTKGLVDWNHESKSVKRSTSPREPAWVQDPRLDSPNHYFVMGRASGFKSEKDGLEKALADGRFKLAERLNAAYGRSPDLLIRPFTPEMMDVSVAPQGKFEAQHACVLLLRAPKARYEEEIRQGSNALAEWVSAEAELRQAKGELYPTNRAAGLRRALERFRTFVSAYPIGAKGNIQTERVLLRLAEEEKERGYPCEAQKVLASLCTQTASADWKAKAQELIAKLGCDEAAAKAEALKREFDGKTVAIVAVQKLGERTGVWRELQGNLERSLGGLGAMNRKAAVAPETALGWTLDPAGIRLPPELQDVDQVWVVGAEGEIAKGDPSALGGIYYFKGESRCTVLAKGKKLFSFADPILGSKWPLEQMCMERLASGLTKRCLDSYLENLGHANQP